MRDCSGSVFCTGASIFSASCTCKSPSHVPEQGSLGLAQCNPRVAVARHTVCNARGLINLFVQQEVLVFAGIGPFMPEKCRTICCFEGLLRYVPVLKVFQAAVSSSGESSACGAFARHALDEYDPVSLCDVNKLVSAGPRLGQTVCRQ